MKINEKENNKKREIRLEKGKWCKWELLANNCELPNQSLNSDLPTNLPPVFIAEHDIIWYVIPLCSVEVSSPGCAPPSFLVSSSPLTGGLVWEAEKALTLCKYSSAIAKTSLYCQHCFCHKSKTQPHKRYYEKDKLCSSQNKHKML